MEEGKIWQDISYLWNIMIKFVTQPAYSLKGLVPWIRCQIHECLQISPGKSIFYLGKLRLVDFMHHL